MANKITIDDVTLPTPALNGVQITHESVWSSNTGRTASAKMVGTIVAYKWKLELKWNAITPAQARTIFNAASGGEWKTVTFTDPGGTEHTIEAYCGEMSAGQYSWVNGIQWVLGTSLHIIER